MAPKKPEAVAKKRMLRFRPPHEMHLGLYVKKATQKISNNKLRISKKAVVMLNQMLERLMQAACQDMFFEAGKKRLRPSTNEKKPFTGITANSGRFFCAASRYVHPTLLEQIKTDYKRELNREASK